LYFRKQNIVNLKNLARLFIIFIVYIMKKKISITTLILFILLNTVVAQKTLTEGTITYDITIQTGNKEPQMADALDGATTTVYIKGGFSRIDMVSALGNEKTIHDAKNGNAVILKEYSGQKLMITLTKENWDNKNKKYDDVVFKTLGEEKKIIGYTCKKATATLKDGSTITVYYTNEVIVTNKEYDQTFKNLPGLPMQYEFVNGKTKFNYTVSSINYNTISTTLFAFPKSGYRVISYDDNKANTNKQVF
jgi:GLPGLI family protein